MPSILPIEQWRSGTLLVDPTGSPYDPNSPPATIAEDGVLGPAVEFARDNAHRIGVTVLCGMQKEAADLGQPGELEAHLLQADLFGSANFGLAVEPGTEGYHNRMQDAFIAAGASSASFRPFNLMDWRGTAESETLDVLQKIEAAIGGAIDVFAVMRSLDLDMVSAEMVADTEEKALDIFAGEVHLANHLNWLTLASACDKAKVFDGYLRGTEPMRILIEESPLGLDIVRKFGALGIEAAVHENRREAWPQDVIESVLDYGSAMTTGRLSAAD